ncbi:hypothetical protein VTK26DRAFT_8704 [Humicola hyalothermophila]
MKRTGHTSLPAAYPSASKPNGSLPTSLAIKPDTSVSAPPDPEPEPAKVVSDILPPLPPSTPSLEHSPAPPIPQPNPPTASVRKLKYATDAERRKATSIAPKERWASGKMDNVVKKRLETMRRRKAEALLGSPGVIKHTGSVSSGTQMHKTSGTSSRGFVPTSSPAPVFRARNGALVSEQLARFLDDDTPSNPSINPGDQEQSGPQHRHSSMTPDTAMVDTGATTQGSAVVHSDLDHDSLVDDEIGGYTGGVKAKDESGTGERPDDLPLAIERTASGRRYNEFKDEHGLITGGYGALFPEGYRLSTTTPQNPWVCPIRSCGKVFADISRLGGHFVKLHRGVRLHDNEDGTFSEREGYAPLSHERRRWSTQKNPALVISRGPPDPSDPPRATSTPLAAGSFVETSAEPDEQESRMFGQEQGVEGDKEDTAPTILETTESGRPYNMWPDANGELMRLFGALLPTGYQLDETISGRPWVCPVRTCRQAYKKASDLGFHFERIHFAARLNDNCDGTFSVRGVYQSKTGSIAGGGKILKKAPPLVFSRTPVADNDGSPLAKVQLPPYLAAKAVREGENEDADDNTPISEPMTSIKDSLRTRAQLSKFGQPEIDDEEPLRLRERREATTQAAFSTHPMGSSSVISQGTFQSPADLLEMEDWEMAPGRIRETSTKDTVAFSKAYLSVGPASDRAVPVCDDVAFRVDTIHAGGTLRLDADPDRIRLCSVAAGKVRVRIGDDEPEFVVGPHGLFKVKAGVGCVVRNGMYIDAVLHVTVLQGYF